MANGKKYKILFHEVTGVNGIGYKRGMVVDSTDLIPESINTLIATGSIEVYNGPIEEPKKAPEAKDYADLKKPELVEELEKRGIDFSTAKNNKDRIKLLIDDDTKTEKETK